MSFFNFRNLANKNSKIFVFLSVVSASWVVFLFTLLFINEKSYEDFLSNSEQVYRISTKVELTDRDDYQSSKTAYALASHLKARVGERSSIAVVEPKVVTIQAENESKTIRLLFADENLFEVLPFPGLKDVTLNNSVLLTQSLSNAFNSFPISTFEVFTEGQKRQYQAQYQLPNLPEQTHFSFDGIVFDDKVTSQWGSQGSGNYKAFDIQLYMTVKSQEVFEEVQSVLKELEAELAQNGNPKAVFKFEFYPIKDIHLYHTKRDDFKEPGDAASLQKYFTAIIVIILLAAVNLSQNLYSKLIEDSHSFGIKSSIGAGRKHMIIDLASDYLPILLASSVIGYMCSILSIEWFMNMLGIEINLSYSLLFIMGGLVLLVPILLFVAAASAPLFFIFRLLPAQLLKMKLNTSLSSSLSVVLSFIQVGAIITLISLASVANKQFTYGYDGKLGFYSENLLIVWGDLDLPSKFHGFKNELQTTGYFSDITNSFFVPGGNTEYRTSTRVMGGNGAEKINVSAYAVAPNFFDTLGSSFVAGKSFKKLDGLKSEMPNPRDKTAYSDEIVINKTAMEALGFESSDKAIGALIASPWSRDSFKTARIVGVIDDMRFRSVFNEIEPTIYFYGSKAFRRMLIRTEDGVDKKEALKVLTEHYERYFSGTELQFNWVSDRIKEVNAETQRQASVFTLFSISALGLVLLGLISSALQTASFKGKEIAIRQIVGCSYWKSILSVISTQFVPLISAGILAIPLSAYLASKWLSQFAERVAYSPGQTVVIAFTFISIAISVFALIVSIRNARLPIHTLREE